MSLAKASISKEVMKLSNLGTLVELYATITSRIVENSYNSNLS